jgi:hypothetical protein
MEDTPPVATPIRRVNPPLNANLRSNREIPNFGGAELQKLA